MTNEDKLLAISDFQKDETIHAMTCAVDSNHRKLIAVLKNETVQLKCLDCDYTQKSIPNVVYIRYLNKK